MSPGTALARTLNSDADGCGPARSARPRVVQLHGACGWCLLVDDGVQSHAIRVVGSVQAATEIAILAALSFLQSKLK